MVQANFGKLQSSMEYAKDFLLQFIGYPVKPNE